MYIYTILSEKDLLKFLSSKILHLNNSKKFVFSKMPESNKTDYVLRFYLDNSSRENLQKIQTGVYFFNQSLNAETSSFKLFVKDNVQLNNVYKLINLYKEVKFSENDKKRIVISTLSEYPHSLKEYIYPIDIDYYEEQKNLFFDKLKGFIYGSTINSSHIQEYMLNEYSTCYSEYQDTLRIISSLKNKNMLDRKVYSATQNLSNSLQKKLLSQLNQINQEKILFSYQENNSIIVNSKFFNLNKEESLIFSYILNKVLKINKETLSLDDISIVMKEAYEYCNQQKSLSSFKDDINIILDRLNGHFNDISILKTVLFRNIYITCSNYYSLSDFYKFHASSSIQNSFLSYAFLGVCKGFSALPFSFINNVVKNSWSDVLMTNTLSYSEKNLYNISYNYSFYRKRLHFLLNMASFDLESFIQKIQDSKIFNVSSENSKQFQQILIKHDKIGSLLIKYYTRKNNLSSSINYFDNRLLSIKRLYPHMKINPVMYYIHSVSPRRSNLPSNISKEYLFFLLLNKVVRS